MRQVRSNLASSWAHIQPSLPQVGEQMLKKAIRNCMHKIHLQFIEVKKACQKRGVGPLITFKFPVQDDYLEQDQGGQEQRRSWSNVQLSQRG